MEFKELPKGTVVHIVIGGDNSSESIQLQNMTNPPSCPDNPVGSTTNERKKELSEDLWGDVSLKCLFFDLNR